MLFLHALLFSLLGASALAIPVPSGADSPAVPAAVVTDLAKQGPKMLDGLWYYIPPVSEHRSRYLTRYQISIGWLRSTHTRTKNDVNQQRNVNESVWCYRFTREEKVSSRIFPTRLSVETDTTARRL
jgi:hypothetical protein